MASFVAVAFSKTILFFFSQDDRDLGQVRGDDGSEEEEQLKHWTTNTRIEDVRRKVFVQP